MEEVLGKGGRRAAEDTQRVARIEVSRRECSTARARSRCAGSYFVKRFAIDFSCVAFRGPQTH